LGYAAWGWLLARYPVAAVAPMSLLVPVFGKPLQTWKLEAVALVMAGLCVNFLWPKFTAWQEAETPAARA